MEALLSLGSNLGDRLANLAAARDAIGRLPQTRLAAASRVYATEPVDPAPAGRTPEYRNAVLAVETGLELRAFAGALFAIEARLGRERPFPNAPRTIDIDVIAFGPLRAAGALNLPHPLAVRRRFVLEPLAEIRGGLVLPGQSRTVRELLAALPTSPRVWPAPEQWE
jgi:2-amino-4-hydroxy-6-hydroxymethyldihydropteridine diphosphokinase